jgi:hypothetical protein
VPALLKLVKVRVQVLSHVTVSPGPTMRAVMD